MAPGFHFFVFLCFTCQLLIGASVTDAAEPADCCDRCPRGWRQFRCRCFQYHLRPMDWANAERFCTLRGANLASLHNDAEYRFIRRMILKIAKSHKTTWVGGYDEVRNGVWLWSNGKRFNFRGWAKGEPNNRRRREGCMDINVRGRDFVNDERCSLRLPFMCARDP